LSYLVHLQQFEGPLGLLLYLIRKEEMDILDINVGEITRQYLDYIRMMKELDLEVAGEFVAMAATLIHIKSRMLLPNYDETGEVLETEDPRKDLVQKLLDYQKYQGAAKDLYARPLLGRDVFARGIREDHRDEESMLAVITEDEGLFSLISAYRRVVRKAERAIHQVRPRVQSIAGRVLELKDRLIVGSRILLRDLLGTTRDMSEGGTGQFAKTQLLITFLSMLELGRMGFVSLFQNETYGDIHIETLKAVERNVLERVQEFDSTNAEDVAASIINSALDEKIDMREAMLSEAQILNGDGEADSPQMSLVPEPELGDISFLEEAQNIANMATDEEILQAEIELGSSDEPAPHSLTAPASADSGESLASNIPREEDKDVQI
jgi:segregation and condensation protein A